jgi:uncharacterized protein with HEPN domain
MARSPRDIPLVLMDILDCLEKIHRYTQGKTFEEFVASDILIDAIIRNCEVIGEATKILPADFKVLHPYINWRKVSDFRNILIHDYFEIETPLVWTIIQDDLPAFEQQIRSLLAAINS